MNGKFSRKAMTLLFALSAIGLGGGVSTVLPSVGSLLGSDTPSASAGGLSTMAVAPPASQPAGSAFTYQGKLLDNGQPVDGQYDFTFKLFDQATGGTQIGSANTANGQPVSAGLFTVYLDFGSTAFTGDARWLETAVRLVGGGDYTTLSPRQPLTPTPYAIHAQSAVSAQTAPWMGITDRPAPYSPLRLPNTVNIADNHGDVGQYTSATVGADGLPLVAYYDVTNEDLKVTHCTNVTCTDRTVSTVDSDGSVGRYTSVTIGTDGLPLISYYDATNQSLKVAHCDDEVCTSAGITTVDRQGRAGRFGSIAIGSDGLGVISYYSEATVVVKVAHCQNQACSGASVSSLPRYPRFGEGMNQSMSIGVGGDGLPVVAFSTYDVDPTGAAVTYWIAHCNDVLCSSASLTSFGQHSYAGAMPIAESAPVSLAIGRDGLPLVAYVYDGGQVSSGALRTMHCTRPDCTWGDFVTVKPGYRESYPYHTGLFPSVSIKPDGLPSISFYEDSPVRYRLQLANCTDTSCSKAGFSTLDSGGDAGRYSSLTMGMDGLPLVSYYDVANGDLKILHCGSPQCVSYQRQR